MASNAAKARYPVIVVGAGIGGLAVSILLAQQGHPVTVLERRRENYISDKANGISLWNNARRVVTGPLNLERELLTVADDTTNTFVKRYDTGETLRKTARRRL